MNTLKKEKNRIIANLCTRRATLADAEAISHVIIQTLEEVNSKDYPTSVINAVIKNFSTEQIAAKMKQRKIFVITQKNHIIGRPGAKDHRFCRHLKAFFNVSSKLGAGCRYQFKNKKILSDIVLIKS